MCEICGYTPCVPGCPMAPDPPVVYCCIKCGRGIYEGDDYYHIEGEPWCEACIASYSMVAELNKEGS